MARAITVEESQLLIEEEGTAVQSKKEEFEAQGKEFVVTEEHWSGVMPEEYRSHLPGKEGGVSNG